jgi:hypothetical protein
MKLGSATTGSIGRSRPSCIRFATYWATLAMPQKNVQSAASRESVQALGSSKSRVLRGWLPPALRLR